MRVVNLIKLQSKGNSLCAQCKIMILWLMIINLIWKLIVKEKKLLTQSWICIVDIQKWQVLEVGLCFVYHM